MTPEMSSPDVRTEALRLISNGVYVLTASGLAAGGVETMHAAAVTWASQVSFQPPLVMIALRRNSHLAEAVRRAHRFALNILSAEQQALAEQFFTHRTAAPDASDIGGAPVRIAVGRCPLLTEAIAWVECKVVAEPPSPGDHALLLGEVTGAGLRRSADPMVLSRTPWSYGGVR